MLNTLDHLGQHCCNTFNVGEPCNLFEYWIIDMKYCRKLRRLGDVVRISIQYKPIDLALVNLVTLLACEGLLQTDLDFSVCWTMTQSWLTHSVAVKKQTLITSYHQSEEQQIILSWHPSQQSR